MSYRNVFFELVLLFITFSSFSQTKQYQYYFDKELNSTKPEKSIFYGIGLYKDSVVELKIYKTFNKTLAFIEHFTDSSLQLRNGLYQSFYADSSMESAGNYKQGKEDGVWKVWDSVGHVIDSSAYINGEKNLDVQLDYNENGVLRNYSVDNISLDQLQNTFYDDSGKVLREVKFKGQKGLEQIYKNESIISSDSLFTRSETEAYFPGGKVAWTRYIMNEIQNHAYELSSGDYGICWVKFIVGIDGKLTNVEAITMQDTNLANIIVQAIKYGPKWQPAMQYGRPVKAYRKQPISISNRN